ncbi:MAG: hypothetical protein OEV59_04330 [Deltaproteobacteria bacterium]|nr:hypothetical protein [Deltaproteobacteria bacterium]
MTYNAAPGAPKIPLDPEEQYQHDLDIARLNDIQTLGWYLEEYRKKTMKYPFQGKHHKPVFVFIITKEQSIYTRTEIERNQEVIELKDFIAELERVLGREIKLPFDPQATPGHRPNYYTYMISGSTYFLAVNLHNPFPFARRIGPNHSKVELTNRPNPAGGLWKYSELIRNKDFVKALEEKPIEPEYVEKLRERIYREGAF